MRERGGGEKEKRRNRNIVSKKERQLEFDGRQNKKTVMNINEKEIPKRSFLTLLSLPRLEREFGIPKV